MSEDYTRYNLRMHGESNSLLHARSRTHFVRDYPGPLSVKSVVSGSVTWRVGAKDLVVDESSVLILHDQEPYSLTIDSHLPVETVCPFFRTGFVESMFAPVDGEGPREIRFVSRLMPKSARMRARLLSMEGSEGLELEEQFLLLARDLVALSAEGREQMARLPAQRAGTREEIYRRVCHGREYLHAHAMEGITLREMARVACLSEFHFHRMFTQAFGKTPSDYVRALRMERARVLLAEQDWPVTEVCVEVGFVSLGTFSRVFRSYFGTPPSRIRKIG